MSQTEVHFGNEQWKALASYPNFTISYAVLGMAYVLFGQATLAFDGGAEAGSSLLCRSALETAFYLISISERTNLGPNAWTLEVPRDLSGNPRSVEWGELWN